MAFKTVFMANAPDEDDVKHYLLREKGKYRHLIDVVKPRKEAIKFCKDLY